MNRFKIKLISLSNLMYFKLYYYTNYYELLHAYYIIYIILNGISL